MGGGKARDPAGPLLQGGDAVARLRAMGVAVVVDDFGTGYSSLKYLRAFPVDGLKIDRCFTEGLGRDRVSEAIVRTIVTLGDTLGIRVVGEGLETERQRVGLLAAGCRLGQGYLLARPMPAGELTALLDAGAR